MKIVSTAVVFLLVVHRFGVSTIDGTSNTDGASLKNGQNADGTPNTNGIDGKSSKNGQNADGTSNTDGRISSKPLTGDTTEPKGTPTLSITLPNMKTQSTMPTTLISLPAENIGFRDIRRENLLFVDKTGFIRKLIDNTSGERLFFMSRPKRFGKSVFLGMLHAFLNGTKELFYNTNIFERGNTDNRVLKDGKWVVKEAKGKKKWVRYPVIYIDFDDIPVLGTAKDFKDMVQKKQEHIAESHGLSNSSGQNIGMLIYDLEKKYHLPVSVLIDNYDKPIITMHDEELPEKEQKRIRIFLRNFYDQIRANNADEQGRLRLVFVVGFSKLNILGNGGSRYRDLTFDDEFSSMMGFTSEEVEQHLKPYVEKYPKKKEETYSTILMEMKKWYGGRFGTAKDAKKILNPASMCQCLREQNVNKDYMGIAQPVPIIKEKMAKDKKRMEDFEVVDVEFSDLEKYKYETTDTVPLHVFMLCTGFLTIKSYNEDTRIVYLGYPNEEVRMNLKGELPIELIGKDTVGPSRLWYSLVKHDITAFVGLLNRYIFKNVSRSLDLPLSEFACTRQILPVLNAADVLYEEGEVIIWGEEKENVKGDLDLYIKSFNTDYPIEVKFNKNAVTAILKLIRYIIEHEMAFRKLIDLKKNIILVGMNIKSYTFKNSGIDASINEWVCVPYKNSKILLNESSTSSTDLDSSFLKELHTRLSQIDDSHKKKNSKNSISRVDSDKVIWPKEWLEKLKASENCQ